MCNKKEIITNHFKYVQETCVAGSNKYTDIIRYPFALKIKEGKSGEFRQSLGRLWPAITSFLDENNFNNFSLWTASDFVFGYCENQFEKKNLIACFLTNQHLDCPEFFQWIAMPTDSMRLMYHDYGQPRTDKSLIRHRIFMTSLKPYKEEEYKRRHDGLVLARNGSITEGPDSNFTIWYAHGYIFGYDEIDTTMEHNMTPDEVASTIAWEEKMLEIMDWITDDVDWITGEHHPHVQRLAWHE